MDEQLSAYFDDELDEGVRASVEAQLQRDPELAARLVDLAFMRTMVVGDLEHQAERVPDARFEQIWDNFEDTLIRESRLQEAAEAPPNLFARLSAWIRPIRVPLAGLAAVGALALVIVRSVGAPDQADTVASEDSPLDGENTQPGAASEAVEAKPGPPARTSKQPSDPQIAAADPRIGGAEPDPANSEVFPQPEPGEAEIRRIEFGGQMGTISQVEGTRGTTTVIWVTEDDDAVDSERSL